MSNFHIDSSSGVLSVLSAIDREEMSSNVISVSIKVRKRFRLHVTVMYKYLYFLSFVFFCIYCFF